MSFGCSEDEVVEEVLEVPGGDAMQLTGPRGAEKARNLELRCRIELTVEFAGASEGKAKIKVKGSAAGVKRGMNMLKALCAFREQASAEERGFCRWFASGFCRLGANCGDEGCEDGVHDVSCAREAQEKWLKRGQPPEEPADGGGASEAPGRPLLLAIGLSGPDESRSSEASAGDGEDELIEFAAVAICPRRRREIGRFHRFVRPSAWADGEAEEVDQVGDAAEGEEGADAAAAAEEEVEDIAEAVVADVALDADPYGSCAAEGGAEPGEADAAAADAAPAESHPAPAVASTPREAARPTVRERFPERCFCEEPAGVAFAEVLADLLDWVPGLLNTDLDSMKREDVLLVCVKDWDVNMTLPRQSNLEGVATEVQDIFFCRWASLYDVFRAFFDLRAMDAPRRIQGMQRHMGLPFTSEKGGRLSVCMQETASIGDMLQELLKSGWLPAPTAWKEQGVNATPFFLLPPGDSRDDPRGKGKGKGKKGKGKDDKGKGFGKDGKGFGKGFGKSGFVFEFGQPMKRPFEAMSGEFPGQFPPQPPGLMPDMGYLGLLPSLDGPPLIGALPKFGVPLPPAWGGEGGGIDGDAFLAE